MTLGPNDLQDRRRKDPPSSLLSVLTVFPIYSKIFRDTNYLSPMNFYNQG